MMNKILSGGQTGADRAALDFAISHGIAHGGWCPNGRLAEDGTIDSRYQLRETATTNYAERTERNVQESDGTAIFTIAPNLQGGSQKTAEFAVKHRKPWIHLHRGIDLLRERLLDFVRTNQIEVLNVAGSRASIELEIYGFVSVMLEEAFLVSDPHQTGAVAD